MNIFCRKTSLWAKENREKPDIVEKFNEEFGKSVEKRQRAGNISKFVEKSACFFLALWAAAANAAPAYANAAESPAECCGPVKVETVRNYRYSDENYQMNIKVPEIQGQGQAGERINREVNRLSQTLAESFYEKQKAGQSKGYGAIYMDYCPVANNSQWFTLKLSVTELAADSNSYFKFYNIDRVKGEIVQLGDLFQSQEGLRLVSADIRRQMEERVKADRESLYRGDEEYLSDFQILSGDHNFCWNKEGNLLIPFDKFEVGAGYIGAPEFIIEKSLIENSLRPEYRNITG